VLSGYRMYCIAKRAATGGPLFANSQRRERFTSSPLRLFAELLLLYALVPHRTQYLYSWIAVLLYRHYSCFIIHTRVIIFRVYTCTQLHVCVGGARARVYRLSVYYNLIYIFNVFISRSVEGEIIITIMTADYFAGRGSPLYKLTLLNRVSSAFRWTAVAVATMRFRLESFTYNTSDVAAAAAAACY